MPRFPIAAEVALRQGPSPAIIRPGTMKALVYTAPETVEIQRLPDPAPADGEVLLEISAAGICGSDIHGFLGHSERRQPGLVMGHEAVARILEVRPGVSGWREGQRVSFNPLVSCRACPACLSGRQNVCSSWRLFGMDRLHGAYAERIAVPACQLLPLSDALPETEAVLIEPLAVLVHAFRISWPEVPETAAVFGAGPIGALALVLAKERGINRVCVVDVNEDRLAVARKLGADLAVDALREDAVEAVRAFTGGGADYVVEAVGIEDTRRASVAATAKGGRIVFLGIASNDSALPFTTMVRNEQSIFTSFAYAQRDFEASLRLIEARRFDLKPWTETRPLEDGQAAFAKMAHDPGSTLKLMLQV
jgi:2-desacetyl-2-hydroxyethyl bacteriochlorophyllide A dehydrogenase